MADTVLLVDYDPRNIAKTRMWLQDAGLEVRLARDGEAAVRTFREWRPDLVVLQDLLPKLHGFEVCRAIKAIAADAPVVLLADARKGRRYAVLETGCDGFVQKPVREPELLDAIRDHVTLREETWSPAPAAPPPVAPPARSRVIALPARIEEADIDATLDVVFDFDAGSREARETERAAAKPAGPDPAGCADAATAPRSRDEPASRKQAAKKTPRKKTSRKRKTGTGTSSTGTTSPGAKRTKKKAARKSTRKAAAKSARTARRSAATVTSNAG